MLKIYPIQPKYTYMILSKFFPTLVFKKNYTLSKQIISRLYYIYS